ncbi:MAG TPA: histidine phosphatase family protein [Steroidobacter sp.]|nr:histidine phosphatase family protein [Steroidobacter sp.]
MLRLLLVRHAQAAPARHGEDDRARALDASGEREVRIMARLLQAQPLRPTRLLSSPARRALRTASILAKELDLPAHALRSEQRLYLAAAQNLQEIVHELGGRADPLMIVGHNPGLTQFASELSSERSIDTLPTCAVCRLEFDIEDWRELEWASGVNVRIDYPAGRR